MSEQIKQELIEDYKSGSSVVFLATYYSLPEREVLEIISEHDALNATREPVGADDAIDRAKMRADLAVRLEVIKEIWGDETEPQIVGHKDGQVEVLERILSDIDFGLWQATRPATREPVGADDVIDLLKVPLGKSINITVEDNDEKLVKQNRSQFDNCPGCNNFWDLEMVNCTMDDPEFIVICRPCGWMARGETIEQAMFNWNRRATRHAAERERALRAEVERLTAALTDIKNYALDKQQWAIANTAELVLGEHADFTANIASATGQDEQGEGK